MADVWLQAGDGGQESPRSSGPIVQCPAQARELVFSLLDLGKPRSRLNTIYKILHYLREFHLLRLGLRPWRRKPCNVQTRQGEA